MPTLPFDTTATTDEGTTYQTLASGQTWHITGTFASYLQIDSSSPAGSYAQITAQMYDATGAATIGDPCLIACVNDLGDTIYNNGGLCNVITTASAIALQLRFKVYSFSGAIINGAAIVSGTDYNSVLCGHQIK